MSLDAGQSDSGVYVGVAAANVDEVADAADVDDATAELVVEFPLMRGQYLRKECTLNQTLNSLR